MATKSNALASGPIRPTTGMRRLSFRYSRSDASVSIDMAHRPGTTLEGREGGRAGLEVGRDVALGVDLAQQGAAAVLGGEQGERGCHRGLPDATLAGDENESPVEEPDQRGRHGDLRGVAQGAPKPTRRSATGAPTST